MSKMSRIKIIIEILCCLVAVMSGCNTNSELTESNSVTEPQGIEGAKTHTDDTEHSERGDTEADWPSKSEASEPVNHDAEQEDIYSRYFCWEADEPEVQEYVAGADEYGFVCATFIKGLAGFTPKSDPTGGILSYSRDEEILIEKNVGMGLLQTERLAEVKETIREMLMDIVREKGRNVKDYQEYFSDETLLQQIDTFLNTKIEDDWLLLESFYFSWYAGNYDEVWWFNNVEVAFLDIEDEEITSRPSETDTRYYFEFWFFADYRTMEYGKDEKAAEIVLTCAVSKETGLIEEISMCKAYERRRDFETFRWS